MMGKDDRPIQQCLAPMLPINHHRGSEGLVTISFLFPRRLLPEIHFTGLLVLLESEIDPEAK